MRVVLVAIHEGELVSGTRAEKQLLPPHSFQVAKLGILLDKDVTSIYLLQAVQAEILHVWIPHDVQCSTISDGKKQDI